MNTILLDLTEFKLINVQFLSIFERKLPLSILCKPVKREEEALLLP